MINKDWKILWEYKKNRGDAYTSRNAHANIEYRQREVNRLQDKIANEQFMHHEGIQWII